MFPVQVFWKHCGKRRNCSKWAISPFPTMFSTCLENFLPCSSKWKLSSANSFSLEESKIRCLGKGKWQKHTLHVSSLTFSFVQICKMTYIVPYFSNRWAHVYINKVIWILNYLQKYSNRYFKTLRVGSSLFFFQFKRNRWKILVIYKHNARRTDWINLVRSVI